MIRKKDIYSIKHLVGYFTFSGGGGFLGGGGSGGLFSFLTSNLAKSGGEQMLQHSL